MKWIYGRQDWKTLERGLENCYLLTNGLGGFSSLTMTELWQEMNQFGIHGMYESS